MGHLPLAAEANEEASRSCGPSRQELHEARTKAMKDHRMNLRDLYRLLEKLGQNPIKDLRAALGKAVQAAYGFDAKKDLLAQLLELNLNVAEREAKGEAMQAPGLPE